jgi:hypothetical protein
MPASLQTSKGQLMITLLSIACTTMVEVLHHIYCLNFIFNLNIIVEIKYFVSYVTGKYIRFDAFPASEYNEVFSGYQPGEVIQFSRDQHFKDHLCPRPQGCRNNLG